MSGVFPDDTNAGVEFIEISDRPDSSHRCSASYTRVLLKSALQMAGCKTRVAHKAAKAVFKDLNQENDPPPETQSESAAKRQAVKMTRLEFEQRLQSAMQRVTDKPAPELDVRIACSIRERRSCVIILLAGTSGTGKSTLASLLAAKMGITTVVSTDSVRHMLRSFTSEEEDPLLWASTYQAGQLMPQSSATSPRSDDYRRSIQGYKAQCGPVLARVADLVARCESRRESLVVEGVHLATNAVFSIASRHACVVPFMVCIRNEAKHRERFAVRAKYMTLDPGVNRYVAHFKQIRTIQDYLVRRAERHAMPRVNNTNVDRSVAAIHATVLAFLRRRHLGLPVVDIESKAMVPVLEDYELCLAGAWSSKGMLQLIRSRKSGGASHEATREEGAPSTSQAARNQDVEFAATAERVARELPVVDDIGRVDAGSSLDVEGASVVEPPVEGESVAETETEDAPEERDAGIWEPRADNGAHQLLQRRSHSQ